MRSELGYDDELPLIVCSVGGTAVGDHLLRLCATSYPYIQERVEGVRMVLVCKPRIDPASIEVPAGVEVCGYVPRLYEHFAACDVAIVQGGGTTMLELTALRTPGNEETYVWTINGQAFPDADPIEVGRDEYVRFEIENKSPMPHPMHLHGHFFRVDNGTGRGPLKDTVLVEPKDRLAIEWVADNLGDWAFHCHQVYHAERGMTRVVKVA